MIATITPGGAAEMQGVRPGDAIATVDGKDARGLGLGDLNWLLSGAPSTAVDVGIEGGGQARTLTLIRGK